MQKTRAKNIKPVIFYETLNMVVFSNFGIFTGLCHPWLFITENWGTVGVA